MNHWFVTFVAICISEIASESIDSKLKTYFNSESVKEFEKKWNNYAVTFETTIGFALKEGFGQRTMNVYVNKYNKGLLIANGYYHTDNQVNLDFKYMMLEAIPHLYDIDVTFPLASNVLMVEASVRKMILHASYVLFRNQSEIIFSPADQDPYKNSPFRFQQVNNMGDVAITIEGCSLSGIIVATLSGQSVNLGHKQLKLKDCQYTVEIYKHGSPSPPVIASYLPKGESGLNLETLLARPMMDELVHKLQGAIFSEVNTSAVFGNDLHKYRSNQEVIFEETRNRLEEVVRGMNARTLDKNMGTIQLDDFSISWDDAFADTPAVTSVKLSQMTLLGLDTLHTSHAGGPISLTEIEVLEELRFSTLQVTGKISIDGINDNSEFAVEINDLAVDMIVDKQHKITLEVLGWRFSEFSCPDLEFITMESLVTGYLLRELPKHIKSHIMSVYEAEKINLHQEIVDEQPLDGALHMATEDLNDPQVLGQLRDRKKDAVPYVRTSGNLGKVKRQKAESQMARQDSAKSHRIAKSHSDQRHVKLKHPVKALTKTGNPKNVPIYLVDHKQEHVEKNETKTLKKVPKKKSKAKRITLAKPIPLRPKRITHASDNKTKMSVTTLKSNHVSDNEIMSN